jgi:hypothetical protein
LTLHHVTGRPFGAAPYWDPALVFEVCLACNIEQDRVWRVSGLYCPMNPTCVRLLRATCWFALVADRRRALRLDATQARALSRLLKDGIEHCGREGRAAPADAGCFVALFQALDSHTRSVLSARRSRALSVVMRDLATGSAS